MMPLTQVHAGEQTKIRKIGGKPEIKKHLENLGFSEGENVAVLTMMSGNIIARVKESRIALGKEMAHIILVH